MGELSKLPNISKVIEGKLNGAGIFSAEQLVETGSREAFFRVKAKDPTACVNMLMAIEGAVRGVRWHIMPDDVKAGLKEYFKSL